MIFKKRGEENNSPNTQENATPTFVWKKWMTITICAVVALILIAVAIFFIVGRNSDGKDSETSGFDTDEQTETSSDEEQTTEEMPDDTETEVPPVDETPEEAKGAKEALDNILSVLEEEPEDATEEIPDFLVETEERNGYEILSFEETETGAIATLRVYAPDLYGIAKELDQTTYTDEAELLAAINAAVKDAELVEKQITLEFEKTDDGYVPIITSEFLDALYGGVFRLYDDLINAEK